MKHIFLLHLIVACRFISFSQDTLLLQPIKVISKQFGQIDIVDNLLSSIEVGVVRAGKSNRFKPLYPEKNLKEDLTISHQSFVSDEKTNKELVIVVNDFYIEEYQNPASDLEYGKIFLNAEYFVSAEKNIFKKLFKIDTTVVFKGTDVFPKLVKGMSELLASNIDLTASANFETYTTYTKEDLFDYTTTEKSVIPVYQAATIADGIYASYKDWLMCKNSYPDCIVTSLSEYKISLTDTLTHTEKKMKLSSLFAIAKNGKHFITNAFGLFEIYKSENDFYFKGLDARYNDAQSGAYIPIGVPGAFIATVNIKDRKRYRDVFLYKIHYKYGILKPGESFSYTKEEKAEKINRIKEAFPCYD